MTYVCCASAIDFQTGNERKPRKMHHLCALQGSGASGSCPSPSPARRWHMSSVNFGMRFQTSRCVRRTKFECRGGRSTTVVHDLDLPRRDPLSQFTRSVSGNACMSSFLPDIAEQQPRRSSTESIAEVMASVFICSRSNFAKTPLVST